MNSESAASAAQQQQATTTTLLSTSLSRLAQQYDKLRSSGDASVGATLAFSKAITAAAQVADQAVQRNLATQIEAQAVLEQNIKLQQQAYNSATSVKGPANDPNQILGIAAIDTSAKESAAVFEQAFEEMEEIARLKSISIAEATQVGLNEAFGINGSIAKSARDSASVFSEEFDQLDEIARLKSKQIAETTQLGINEAFGIGSGSKSAAQSAAVFQEEFDRLDQIAKAKSAQIASDTQAALSDAFGMNGISKSARDSAAVFEESFAAEEQAAAALDDFRSKAAALRAELDPTAAAFGEMFEAVKSYDEMLGAGVITAQEFALAQQKARDAFQQSVVASYADTMRQAYAEQERMAQSAAMLRAQIDPFGASIIAADEQLVRYQALEEAGAISGEELAKAIELQVPALQSSASSVMTAASAHANLSTQAMALSHVMRGSVEQFMLGVPVTTILAQQFNHLSYALTGPQGLSGAFAEVGVMVKEVGTWLLSLLTPFNLTVAAMGGISIVAIASVLSWQTAQRQIVLALTGIGAASQATAADINRISNQMSSPFGLSISEARVFATELASVGTIGKYQIASLVQLGHDFATTMGQDAATAAKTLADAMSDPVKGADQLNQRLGFMDAAMKRNIQNLVEQNNLAAAQQLIIQGIQGSIAKASDVTGVWTQLWGAISNAVSNAYDKIGQILSWVMKLGGTLEEQLQNAQDRVTRLQAQANNGNIVGTALFGAVKIVDPDTVQKLQDAQKEVQRLTDKIGGLTQAAADAKTRMQSLQVSQTIMSFLPEIDQLQKAINSQMVTGGTSEDGVLIRSLGLTQANVDRAKAIAAQLVASFKTAFQEMQTQAAIAYAAITAFSPAAKASIAFLQEQERVRTSTNLSPDEKTVAAWNAYNLALKQANTQLSEAQRERELASRQETSAASVAIQAIGQNVGEQYRLQAVEQARAQLEQEANRNRIPFDEKKLQTLSEQIALTAVLKQREAEEKAINDATFDQQTVFLNDTEKQIAQVQRSLQGNNWKDFMDDGLSAMKRLTANLNDLKTAIEQSVSGLVKDLFNGTDLVTALQNAMKQLAQTLVDNVVKKLVDQLLNSAFSSLTQGAIAGGSQAAAMTTGATSAATILTAAGQTLAATMIAAATSAASILTGGSLTSGATLAASGTAAGAAVAGGSTAGGVAIASSGAASGTAIAAGATAGATALDAAAAAIGLSTGNVIAIVAAIAAVAGFAGMSMFGKKDDALAQAQTAWTGMSDQLKQFEQTAAGFDMSGPAAQIDQLRKTADQLFVGAVNAQDWASIGPIWQAFGDNVKQVVNAFEQGQAPLSTFAKQIVDLTTQATQLAQVLQQNGDGGDAAAVLGALPGQIAAIQQQASQSVQAAINTANGQDYINTITDLFTKVAQEQAEQPITGLSTGLINSDLQAEAQKAIDDAGLVGDSFNQLLTIFPQLTGVVHESASALQSEADAAAQAQQTLKDFWDNLADNINQFIESIQFGNDSILTSAQQYSAAQSDFQTHLAAAQGGNQDELNNITKYAQTYLDQARSYLGPSVDYGTVYNQVVDALNQLLGQRPAGLQMGGIVGAYDAGGMVGNGLWNMDSVRARFAGGGDIALAGGEWVTRATSVNSSTLPALNYINQHGRTPSNDNSAVVAEVRAMRGELARMTDVLGRLAAEGNETASSMLQETRASRRDDKTSKRVAAIRAKKTASN